MLLWLYFLSSLSSPCTAWVPHLPLWDLPLPPIPAADPSQPAPLTVVGSGLIKKQTEAFLKSQCLSYNLQLFRKGDVLSWFLATNIELRKAKKENGDHPAPCIMTCQFVSPLPRLKCVFFLPIGAVLFISSQFTYFWNGRYVPWDQEFFVFMLCY